MIELIFYALNFTFFYCLCLLATGERKSEGVCLYYLLSCRNKSPIFFTAFFFLHLSAQEFGSPPLTLYFGTNLLHS